MADAMADAIEEGTPPEDKKGTTLVSAVVSSGGAEPEPSPAAAAEPPAKVQDRSLSVSLTYDELPDEALVQICGSLDVQALGRLACAALRFADASITLSGCDAKVSPIEAGARVVSPPNCGRLATVTCCWLR